MALRGDLIKIQSLCSIALARIEIRKLTQLTPREISDPDLVATYEPTPEQKQSWKAALDQAIDQIQTLAMRLTKEP